MTELFFRDSPDSLPRVGDAARAAAGLENWAERSTKIEDPDLVLGHAGSDYLQRQRLCPNGR